MTTITIPQKALVMLVGPAGSGKSSFAAQHFRASEIVSSDVCREMVSDNMEDMACSSKAFELFHFWIEKRLQLGRLTVADATNLNPKARTTLREIAAKYDMPIVVFALDSSLALCKKQNRGRTRYVPEHVIAQHYGRMVEAMPALVQEGYQAVYPIRPRETPVEVVVESDQISAPGFDVIGDLHGTYDELVHLVFLLGYEVDPSSSSITHPAGRKLVFVGDLTDRGPSSVEVLHFVHIALANGSYATMGNHDNKLYRYLKGNNVRAAHGLARTIQQLESCSEEEKHRFRDMLASLPHYLRLTVPGHDELVVCHAGMPREMVGRPQTGEVKSHCLYGATTGEKDENGFPIRTENWKQTWPAGGPVLVHGHTVKEEPFDPDGYNVVCVDQGAVRGGKLTAYRYPERVCVSVQAPRDYAAEWDSAEV